MQKGAGRINAEEEQLYKKEKVDSTAAALTKRKLESSNLKKKSNPSEIFF